MRQTWDPDRLLDEWFALGLWRHLLGFAILAAFTFVRWHHWLELAGTLLDETVYIGAFRAVGRGASPYDVPGYHYTPFFAWVGARLVAWQGEVATLYILRGASVAGLALAVWCSLAWLGGTWGRRLLFGVLYVALAPPVAAGFSLGNVSFAAIGVVVASLMTWSRGSAVSASVPSGIALGTTVAAKPLAPLALVALFCHRPAVREGKSPSPRHWIAGAVGGATAFAFILPMIPRLAEMAAQPIHQLSYRRSFSLHKILSLLGIDVSPTGILVLGALLLAVVVRLRPFGRSELVAVAATASVMATPIIWNHTLVMTLPLQAMTLSLAIGRWRDRAAVAGRGRWYELIVIVLGAIALQFSEGLGAVDEFPSLPQAGILAFGYLTPAALLAYLLVVGSVRRNA